MYKDQYDRIIVNDLELFDLIYSGKLKTLKHVFVEKTEEIEKFFDSVNQNKDTFDTPKYPSVDETSTKTSWLIPKNYQNFDIALWLIEQCRTDVELNRVVEELELYVKFDLLPVLNCIKYLVDTMRTHNIVWGVGRGSSVASYCLYLIGLHKIDSIKYNLNIQEFFKEKNYD